GSIGLNALIRSVEAEDRPGRDQSQACGPDSLAQITLDDAGEVARHDHAAHQLMRLTEIDPAQRGAVAEPEGEPVAGLACLVRLRTPRGAPGDHLDQRPPVPRRRDRGPPPAPGPIIWRGAARSRGAVIAAGARPAARGGSPRRTSIPRTLSAMS